LYQLTGHYVLAYKLGAALFAGGFTAALMAAGYRVAGARAAILLGAWTLCSGHLTYFAAQYPKNLLGMSLLLLFVAVLAGTRPRWIWAAALLILGYFGHRFTFGLSVVFGGLWLLFRYGAKPWAYLSSWKTGVAAGILLILLLLTAVLSPGLLHWSDGQRLSGHLSARPQWPPWSFYTSFGPERVAIWWRIEIILACLIWLWACLHVLQKAWNAIRLPKPAQADRNAIVLLVLVTCLHFPFLDWSLTGLSYRAFLVFVLISPLLLLNLWPLQGSALTQLRRAVVKASPPNPLSSGAGVGGEAFFAAKPNFMNTLLRALMSIAIRLLLQPPPLLQSPPIASNLLSLATLATFSTLATFTYRPSLHDPNYALYRSVTRNSLVRLENKARPDLVIAPNALAEFFTFHTGIDAMPWQPEYAIAPDRLWRIASGVREPAIRHYAPADSLGPIFTLPGRYLFLQERRWQSAIQAASMTGDTAFVHACRTWPNPSSVRPAFLLRRKVRGQKGQKGSDKGQTRSEGVIGG
jgi:hypothetical protein